MGPTTSILVGVAAIFLVGLNLENNQTTWWIIAAIIAWIYYMVFFRKPH